MTRRSTSKPRRHHTIPAFYLRRFANPKSQAVAYRRSTAKKITTSVSNLAVETDFYAVIDESGEVSMGVEELLSLVESHAHRVMVGIDQGNFPPNGEDRSWLALFLALLMCRTQEFRRTGEIVADFIAKLQLQGLSRENIRSQLLEKDGREPPEAEVDRIAELIDNPDGYEIKPHTNDSVGLMLELAKELGPRIEAMSWHLIKGTKRLFLTSDRPIILWRTPSELDKWSGIGLATADEVYVPLDPRTLLLLMPDSRGLPDVLPATRVMAKDVNQLIVHSSFEWIFHHPKHDPLHRLTIPKERPLSYINGTPLYRDGRGVVEALRQFRSPTESSTT